MKKILSLKIFFMALVFGAVSTASAEPVRDFLVSCGYGTLIGAGVGVVTLAFEKNPGEHTNNIARGASLGLYGGIGYSLYQMSLPQKNQDVVLTFDSGQETTWLNYFYRF